MGVLLQAASSTAPKNAQRLPARRATPDDVPDFTGAAAEGMECGAVMGISLWLWMTWNASAAARLWGITTQHQAGRFFLCLDDALSGALTFWQLYICFYANAEWLAAGLRE